MTHPDKNASHYASVVRVDGACEHAFNIHGVVATLTVESYQQD